MMMLDAYESSMVKQRQQVRGGSKETKKDAERQALAYCTIRTSKRRYPSAVIMGAGPVCKHLKFFMYHVS
jgi:hypothetical protein